MKTVTCGKCMQWQQRTSNNPSSKIPTLIATTNLPCFVGLHWHFHWLWWITVCEFIPSTVLQRLNLPAFCFIIWVLGNCSDFCVYMLVLSYPGGWNLLDAVACRAHYSDILHQLGQHFVALFFFSGLSYVHEPVFVHVDDMYTHPFSCVMGMLLFICLHWFLDQNLLNICILNIYMSI